MTTIAVDKILPKTGTSLTLGDSGDTITVPSGVTFENLGTATGFGTAGIVGAKTTLYTGSQAVSGSNWQEWTPLQLTYTAASTSNRLLFLAQVTVAISGTTCAFRFYNNTTGAIPTGAGGVAQGSRQAADSRSHVNSTSWKYSHIMQAFVTPPNTSANQYTIQGWDHNAGGVRINSNHDNNDGATADRSRAISLFTILEFGSGIIT